MPQDRTPGSIKGKSVSYEVVIFNPSDSPKVHDLGLDLGRNSVAGYITCDGPGDIQVQFSQDGFDFSGVHTLKPDEVLDLEYYNIKIIHVLSTGIVSSYRILVI